jgi:hypothetical protein
MRRKESDSVIIFKNKSYGCSDFMRWKVVQKENA